MNRPAQSRSRTARARSAVAGIPTPSAPNALAVAEFDELVADIKAHGVREPIWLFESKILDGRNRYSAAQGAGVDCPTRSYDGDDPLSFVVSANLRRRQRYRQRAHRRRVRAGQLEAGGVTVRAPPSGTASRASVAANGFGKTQRNRGGRCRPTHARNSKSAKRGD